MNKAFFLFFAAFWAILHPIGAETQPINVEIRSAAFFHSAKRFKEIYGKIGCSYQVEASTHLWDCWDGWVSFDWFSHGGKPKKCHAHTRVSIANMGFGIKYPYRFCEKYIAYIGIGPCISRIWLKNKSHCENERVSKVAVGGLLKTGIYYFITCNIFLDVFVDYLYQPVHFEKHVDIGGIKTGVGAGIQF